MAYMRVGDNWKNVVAIAEQDTTDFVMMQEKVKPQHLGIGRQGGKGINDLCFLELFLEALPSS